MKRILEPPKTVVEPVKETLHGLEITDPYRWLENQTALDTRAWIDAQNRYTRKLLDDQPGRQIIAKRLTALMRIDNITAPSEHNGRFFYYRKRADQELYTLYMREGLNGKERTLLDPHPLSPDYTVSYAVHDITDDGKWIAFGIREGGQDETDVRFMDIDTGKELPEKLPKAYYLSVSLTADKRGIYYSKFSPEGSRIYYHELGSDPANDPLIFGEGYSPDKILTSGISDDGKWLMVYIYHGWSKNEVYSQALAPGKIADPKGFANLTGGIDATVSGTVVEDTFYAQTDWNAPNGRIVKMDLRQPGSQNWQEIIPAADDVLEGFSMVNGHLCARYLQNVLPLLKIYTPDGKLVREIRFPHIGTLSGMSGKWKSRHAFFTFTSYNLPSAIYHYDLVTHRRKIWDKPKVPVRSDPFVVKQVWYTSKDGTRVPMFLAHKKGLKRNGANPVLLTGYGGFRGTSTPSFSSMAIVWMEHGGVWATANLRGGGEFGEKWHKAGMQDRKQNVFDDFVAAAEWLIREKYTRTEKLAAMGGSNGGLLVGAALTQRPDLFGAVICTYPLLDMLRYHKMLVGSFWIPEYGSPDDPKAFEWLRAYSPYHNVKQGEQYPAVLFVTGDSDTRVDPAHARKMTALLQAATGSGEPVLLLYDTKAGHSGGRPIRLWIEDMTDELSFLFWRLQVPVK